MEIKRKINPTLKFVGRDGIYNKYLKRLGDIFLSLVAIIVLSPVLLIVALLVKINLGGPIIFKQERPGLNEKIFTMYKFRTMTEERDEKGELLPEYMRLTKFGRILRSASLDELPELLNVLKGDMSLIGPRPLLVEYLPLYNEYQKNRHTVKPGISGLAQVNGRNGITWEEKFAYDLYYIENVSLLLDLRIIFKTFLKVWEREGVNKNEFVTMEKFRGTKELKYKM